MRVYEEWQELPEKGFLYRLKRRLLIKAVLKYSDEEILKHFKTDEEKARLLKLAKQINEEI